MIIKTKFGLEQKVKIIELECLGIIIGIFYGRNGVEYNIRYFYNGEAKTVYFYENELKVV